MNDFKKAPGSVPPKTDTTDTKNVVNTFVLGHPITHSRSPIIHNHWIKAGKLSGRYEAIDIVPGHLAKFLNNVRTGKFGGGNVTVPLKEEAYAAVDYLTQAARSIGAVNTIYRVNDQLWGDNTDAYGFSANLDVAAPYWRKAETAVVVGAGGAARAIIKSLLDAGLAEIHVLNRTLGRAEELAASFGPTLKIAPLADFASTTTSADLIINTSSIGMAGNTDLIFDFSTANPSALVTDIVYVPLETGFLKSARLAGLKTVDGLGMLLHQAVPGFEHWYGVRPHVTPELRNIIEADLFQAKS
jgi:shikimate dehydrogenase